MMTQSKLMDDLYKVHNKLLQNIDKSRNKSVDKYVWIQMNVSSDEILSEEFQKKWSDFYRLNATRISKDQKKLFYSIFYEYWVNSVSITDLLQSLFDVRNGVESSFASKIQHTKNPNMPIIDSLVAKVLGWKLPREQSSSKSQIIELTENMIERLSIFYSSCFQKDQWVEISENFDRCLGVEGFKYTDVKKMDILLWQRSSLN